MFSKKRINKALNKNHKIWDVIFNYYKALYRVRYNLVRKKKKKKNTTLKKKKKKKLKNNFYKKKKDTTL